MTYQVYLVTFGLAVLVWLGWKLLKIGTREAGLPPGPPTIPILGNLASVPTSFLQHQFTAWAKEYGPIYSLKFGPQTTIVLTGATVVRQLMDVKSASTSDRPPLHVMDLISGGNNLAFCRYREFSLPDDVWRRLRKAVHSVLTPQAAMEHTPIQAAETAQLLHDLLHTPEHFFTHIGRWSNSVIMSILFGIRSPRYETSHSKEFHDVIHLYNLVATPGSQPPVDLIPILKYIPERFASWKRLCTQVRTLQRRLYFRLRDECEARMKQGLENGSYMEKVLQRQGEMGLDRELTGYIGGVLLEGGSETTTTFLHSLVLLLTAYPEVQQKAWEEIDGVVGDRIPRLEDSSSLPYVNAIIKEVHRLRPGFPLGLPHASIAPERCAGYLIPKGATIFVNIWGIFHDPEYFEEPEKFWPDRFLLTEHGTKPGLDAQDFRSISVFGCGRRVCPGNHVAANAVLLNAMNLLWAFKFEPPTDNQGKPLPVDIWNDYTGISLTPRKFDCIISCRLQSRRTLIEQHFLEAIPVLQQFEHGLDEEEVEQLQKQREEYIASQI